MNASPQTPAARPELQSAGAGTLFITLRLLLTRCQERLQPLPHWETEAGSAVCPVPARRERAERLQRAPPSLAAAPGTSSPPPARPAGLSGLELAIGSPGHRAVSPASPASVSPRCPIGAAPPASRPGLGPVPAPVSPPSSGRRAMELIELRELQPEPRPGRGRLERANALRISPARRPGPGAHPDPRLTAAPGAGHRFEPRRRGLHTWCDLCGDFVWGGGRKSLQCRREYRAASRAPAPPPRASRHPRQAPGGPPVGCLSAGHPQRAPGFPPPGIPPTGRPYRTPSILGVGSPAEHWVSQHRARLSQHRACRHRRVQSILPSGTPTGPRPSWEWAPSLSTSCPTAGHRQPQQAPDIPAPGWVQAFQYR